MEDSSKEIIKKLCSDWISIYFFLTISKFGNYLKVLPMLPEFVGDQTCFDINKVQF